MATADPDNLGLLSVQLQPVAFHPRVYVGHAYNFRRLDTVPTCDRQTDTQTDLP